MKRSFSHLLASVYRQYRYYDSGAIATDAADYAKPSTEGGVQLAVPETGHIPYGLQIPGFMDRLEDWAREHQQEAMAGVPRNPNRARSRVVHLYYMGVATRNLTLRERWGAAEC